MAATQVFGFSNETVPTDSRQARAAFEQPLAEYGSAPLWVWNDLITDELLTSSLHDLASQNLRQVIVHPRPGLVTPYLSEEWFRLWDVLMRECDRLGMRVWIYDENSYPSGFAGGHVPEEMPESRQKGMVFREEPLPSPLRAETLAVFRFDGNRAEEISGQVRSGAEFTTGSYLTVQTQAAGNSPWYGGRSYVDLLNPEVTRKFLEVTLEPYRKRLGERFGKTILGAFTDEPNIRVDRIAWTPSMFELFRKRWGYDLKPHLASLARPVGDWKRVRQNFWQMMNEQFVESWARPYYEFCEANHLQATGHYWDHEWPNIAGVPDNMAMYSWQQRPALDCLMNNYQEHTHGQFGNARMAREVSSVANQTGRRRTLCEAYGAGGWDLRFEDMKRIADWLAVLGVNTFDEHLSYMTIRGARKRDHPQSFSYHTPWWPDYHVMATYLARLSAAMSQGEQLNPVLVLQPTTTAYLYQAESGRKDALKEVGDAFQNFHIALERAQVEYDMGSEYVMAERGAVKGKELEIGKRRYATVVLPARTENLNAPTVTLLEEFSRAGGRVICCGEIPSLLDGQTTDRLQVLADRFGWQRLAPEEAVARLQSEGGSGGFRIEWRQENNGILFHQRRQLTDGELLLLVNTSMDQPARGSWRSASARSAERWNLETGAMEPGLFESGADGIGGNFDIPPCGSLLLLLKREEPSAGETKMTAAGAGADSAPEESAPDLASAASPETTRTIPATGAMTVHRTEPNVLTLDFVDLKTGDEMTTGQYFFPAARKVFESAGLPASPWERAVQFRDEILRMKLPADSTMEASYRFTIRDEVPEDLAVVIERPDLYRITCNGLPVSAGREWWLDRAFGKIDISAAARKGENRVTISARPLTIYHELEPAYVLGSFALEPSEHGFEIVADRPLQPGEWKAQGHPFYGAAVAYRHTFPVERVEGRYRVKLGQWLGSVARVRVNGKEAGRIGWAPWECDVTEALRPGDNEVEVTVVGTLKNPLGPHHHGRVRGTAWPAHFHTGPQTGPPPGEKYDLIGYGLFEPFQLIQEEQLNRPI